LTKIGTPPRVFYRTAAVVDPNASQMQDSELSENTREVIDENYLTITPSGELKTGWEGFLYWCQKTQQEPKKTADEYAKTIEKYNKFKVNGIINGTEKFKSTFEHNYISEVFYVDFYSIERFGKTKLGALLLYAKQSQDRRLMRMVFDLVKDKIEFLIKEKNIDAIGFIPHTVPRKVQLMTEIERLLNINLPRINIVKALGTVPVAQKTLSKLEDRIENAGNTIFVKENFRFNNILLIDDAVGSGATFNETAKKIREKNLSKHKLIGLALTGSFKGFEVLNEV
jgi:hypothetical protein